MAKTGLLVVTHPARVNRFLPSIPEYVQNILYVHLSPLRHIIPQNDESTLPLNGNTVMGIYSQTSALCKNLDVRVLLSRIKDPLHVTVDTRREIEIVFFDENYSVAEMDNFVQSFVPNATPNCQRVNFSEIVNNPGGPFVKDDVREVESPLINKWKMYDNVVLGGTFDRLHAGHKILLSEAILSCSKKLTVGVTDTPMLKTKKLWELIEPCAKRISDVRDFLLDVDPKLYYEIVPIVDPYGPTKEDPNLQMIVVSSETLKGGKKVNEVRAQNGLCALVIQSVDLLEAGVLQCEHEEAKISSSNQRMRLLGTWIRTPEIRPSLPHRPYIIGLTGIIASGKSSTCERIARLGAGIINCDTLAHGLYRKGHACHSLLLEHFGEGILDAQGEVDRKALGALVFQNKENLQLLNDIMWPAILETAKAEELRLYKEGYEVVVMDAAVLIQAGWDQHCHAVWVCIVPPEEAMKRMLARNGLSSTEAEARLSTQHSNSELVAHAHVVFCTAWDPEFTQYQVEKAWNQLQNFLH